MSRFTLFTSLSLLLSLPCANAAMASASLGSPTVVCEGQAGSTRISKTLHFGAHDPNPQDLAVVNGIAYAIELGNFDGLLDLLFLSGQRDETGAYHGNTMTWIRAHGARQLEYVDNSRALSVSCTIHY